MSHLHITLRKCMLTLSALTTRSELKPGDYVTISASRFPFPSVLPLDRKSEDWVDSISRTLNWNNRQRQKAFDKKIGSGGEAEGGGEKDGDGDANS